MPVATEVSLSELIVLFSNLSLFQETTMPSSQSELIRHEQEEEVSPSSQEGEKEGSEEEASSFSQKGEKDSSKKAAESAKSRSLK